VNWPYRSCVDNRDDGSIACRQPDTAAALSHIITHEFESLFAHSEEKSANAQRQRGSAPGCDMSSA